MSENVENESASARQSKQCMVAGCSTLLVSQPKYCLQRGLCTEHMKADAVHKRDQGDALFRYCQQCGKLEPLELFDGHKRSCRMQLAKRRAVSFSKSMQAGSTSRASSAGSGDSGTPVLGGGVRKGGVRKALTCSSLDFLMLRAQQQQQQQQQLYQPTDISSRMLSLQQQLHELESQVGVITSQQCVRNQLTFLQRQYDALLETVALQRQQQQQQQQQQQHLLQLDPLAVSAATAMGGFQVGYAAAGGLGVAALTGAPAATAVPVLVAPTASGLVPVVLPGAAGGAPSALLLPAAAPVAATAGLGAQAALLGLPVQAGLANGLGLALQLQQQANFLQQVSGSISSDSTGSTQGVRSSLARSLSVSDAASAAAAAAAGVYSIPAVGGVGATPVLPPAASGTLLAPAAASAAVAQASADQAALQAQLQGPSQLQPGWESLLLDDVSDLQQLLTGQQLGHQSSSGQGGLGELGQPQVPQGPSPSHGALLQGSSCPAGAAVAADAGHHTSPPQHQPLVPTAGCANSAAAGATAPAAARLEACNGESALLQEGLDGFDGSAEFAGFLDDLLMGMEGYVSTLETAAAVQ